MRKRDTGWEHDGGHMTSLILSITLTLAYFAGFCQLVRRRRSDSQLFGEPPWALIVALAVTTALSGLQFVYPGILTALERNRSHLLDGQVWRLISPLFVQDGGATGTVFNLIALVLLGVVGVAVLGWRRWLILYFGTGFLSEIVAYTLIHQGKAGNSIANFGVAAGLVLFALWRRQMPCAVIGGAGAITGIALLAIGNLHGAAFVIGLIIAGPLLRADAQCRLAPHSH